MSWRPRSFIDRIGAALVAPRAALAAADAQDAAGRTGTDAAVLLLFGVFAVHTTQVAVSIWLGVADSIASGLSALVALIGRSVGTDLVFILVAGVVVTAAAGKRRSMGRDFDLACVAYVPFVAVKLLSYLVVSLAGIEPTRAVTDSAMLLAIGWSVVVLALGIAHARQREDAVA